MYNEENNYNQDFSSNNDVNTNTDSDRDYNTSSPNGSEQNSNEANGYSQNQNQPQNWSQNQMQNQNQNGGYRQNGNYGYQNYQQNNPYGTPYGGNQNPNNNGKWKKVMAGAAVVAGIVFIGGVGAYGVGKVSDQLMKNPDNQIAATREKEKEQPEVSRTPKLDNTEEIPGVSDSVASVVQNVMPAIVSITTTSTETGSDFFGRPYSENVQGSGSGIIIGQNTNEILIATNNHVISGQGASVEVTFNDGKNVKGTVKGAEPSSDLAVVSVKFADITDETKESIKVISIGNSEETKVGELAIAIGNALGYGQSVTVGHVSALDREIAVEDSSMKLMQTDAAINPGNSGGALLNARGQLIGINSAKTATTEVEGMGYAIPISVADPIIKQLMEGKNSSGEQAAYLGIVGQNITKSNSQRFNIPIGVYVTEIVEGSPAEKAGIKTGMVIVGLDGKQIKDTDDIKKVLDSLSVGDMVTVNVAVNNGGKYETKEVTVTMGSKAEQDAKDSGSSNNGGSRQNPNEGGQEPDDDQEEFYGEDPFGFFGD